MKYAEQTTVSSERSRAEIETILGRYGASSFAYMWQGTTAEGETVLDNCMGSGSTGVAAIQTGRKFIGIELEQKYFDIARDRIEKSTKQETIVPKTVQLNLFEKLQEQKNG